MFYYMKMSQNILGNILPCKLNVHFVTWKCHKIINEAFVYVHIYNGKIYLTQHVCCVIQCLFPKITHLQESHNCWLVLLRLSSKIINKGFVYVHICNGKIYFTQHVCSAIQCLFPKITHLQESHNCWLVLLRLSSKTQ